MEMQRICFNFVSAIRNNMPQTFYNKTKTLSFALKIFAGLGLLFTAAICLKNSISKSNISHQTPEEILAWKKDFCKKALELLMGTGSAQEDFPKIKIYEDVEMENFMTEENFPHFSGASLSHLMMAYIQAYHEKYVKWIPIQDLKMTHQGNRMHDCYTLLKVLDHSNERIVIKAFHEPLQLHTDFEEVSKENFFASFKEASTIINELLRGKNPFSDYKDAGAKLIALRGDLTSLESCFKLIVTIDRPSKGCAQSYLDKTILFIQILTELQTNLIREVWF